MHGHRSIDRAVGAQTALSETLASLRPQLCSRASHLPLSFSLPQPPAAFAHLISLVSASHLHSHSALAVSSTHLCTFKSAAYIIHSSSSAFSIIHYSRAYSDRTHSSSDNSIPFSISSCCLYRSNICNSTPHSRTTGYSSNNETRQLIAAMVIHPVVPARNYSLPSLSPLLHLNRNRSPPPLPKPPLSQNLPPLPRSPLVAPHHHARSFDEPKSWHERHRDPRYSSALNDHSHRPMHRRARRSHSAICAFSITHRSERPRRKRR